MSSPSFFSSLISIMRLFRLNKNDSCRIRTEGFDHGNFHALEGLGGFQWVYKVDTWKLPNFERWFIDSQDRVSHPRFWQTLNYWTLYLGTELQCFVSNTYFIFWYTKTFIPTWEWQEYFERTFLSEYFCDMDVADFDDLREYEEDHPEHDWISFLNQLYSFSYNNETSAILIFETMWFNVFYGVWLYFDSHKSITPYKVKDIMDYLYLLEMRYGFVTSTKNQVVSFFFDYLNSILLVKVGKLRSLTNTQKLNRVVYSSVEPASNSVNIKKLISFLNRALHLKTEVKLAISSFVIKPVNIWGKQRTSLCASLLRKNKVYTKSKYSRSRQYCKNIVLLGLLLNIILMFGLNSSSYAILINAGYFIYPLYMFFILYTIYVVRKYKLYSLRSLW